jgi:hypothetical protein
MSSLESTEVPTTDAAAAAAVVAVANNFSIHQHGKECLDSVDESPLFVDGMAKSFPVFGRDGTSFEPRRVCVCVSLLVLLLYLDMSTATLQLPLAMLLVVSPPIS